MRCLTSFDLDDLIYAAIVINHRFVILYYLSLSAELLKNIKELIKGFHRIGVCPWLAATSCVSCLGLSFVDFIYVLSTFYLYINVIAILSIDIGLIRRIEVNCSKHRTYHNLTKIKWPSSSSGGNSAAAVTYCPNTFLRHET